MKRLVLFVMAFFVCALMAATVMAADKDVFEFPNAKGKVTFAHKMHQPTASCDACHHGQAAGKETGCKSCHSKDSKVNAKTAFHKNCIDCHKQKGKGPTKCNDCHKK